MADVTDVPAVARLHRYTALVAFADIFPADAPPPDPARLIDEWTTRIEAPPSEGQACFVAQDGSEIVGVIVAGRGPRDATYGHLSRLYVDPPRWGTGIGRTLYECGMTHLRAQNLRTATLWVLEANVHARAWYERLGWRLTTDRLTTYAPAGIDDVGYERSL